jgi:hypothetical protein
MKLFGTGTRGSAIALLLVLISLIAPFQSSAQNLDLQPYSLESVRLLAIKQVERFAEHQNLYLTGVYVEALAQWRQHDEWATASQKPRFPRPQAPNVVMVAYDENNWPMLVPGPQIKVPEPTATKPPSNVVAIVGPQAGDQNVYGVGFGDNAPLGYVTERDGSKFEKRIFSNPWGKIPYYAKLQ